MDTAEIIQSLDREISGLQRARDVLAGKKPRDRYMSPAARKRISDAQKKRWAKQKQAA